MYVRFVVLSTITFCSTVSNGYINLPPNTKHVFKIAEHYFVGVNIYDGITSCPGGSVIRSRLFVKKVKMLSRQVPNHNGLMNTSVRICFTLIFLTEKRDI